MNARERRTEAGEAFLLHHRPYRNTSQLLDLFTREHGVVPAVARGSRGARSRLRGQLQPFTPLRVAWSGRGELVTLTEAETTAPPAQLGGTALMAGYYANELLLRLLARHDANEHAFLAYARLLAALVAAEAVAPALRYFERDLLEGLGYGLHLEREVSAGVTLTPEGTYRYDLEHGPVRVEDAGAAGAVPGRALIALRTGRLGPEEERAVRGLLRAALELYLGGRPLKSRSVLEAVLRL